jgi:hypothetical protein
MELDDPGFHHSVLADFRERLVQGDRADRLLAAPVSPRNGRIRRQLVAQESEPRRHPQERSTAAA